MDAALVKLNADHRIKKRTSCSGHHGFLLVDSVDGRIGRGLEIVRDSHCFYNVSLPADFSTGKGHVREACSATGKRLMRLYSPVLHFPSY